MKRPLVQTLTVAAVAATSALALPAAAQAAAIYPPSDSCAVSPATAGAGESLDFSCNAATFSANEPVTITVTGENGAGVTFGAAFVKFAITTGSTTTTSTDTGALEPITITLPSDARGVYNIAAISPTSAGGAGSTTVGTGGAGLATTGGDASQFAGLWLGGGALVLAGAAVAAGAAVRRARSRA
ncbi:MULTISPECIES: cell wall protein [unclassified Microbacterium]|uniref:cell wall protein n=1 Tax=unclassified Microbacterium TaxID=2609290 RepID=UPI00254F4651|nr:MULTISPECIES: cell wall protein [unclassified Microbacterium]WIM22818.1 cell wall protein [Microbacterium sp. zg-Y818]